ncbi:unnamed protein product [Rotaria sordida]|uniref:Fungal lipase-like domain-containing protein n=2 Tax=Rotaria sordida TaxID=392033 RepID=A0A814WD30_9BILA|nr:unnamed protein product [Rotaria sordida]CAF1200771.1 unnamed protein product [Rotaria sordida]
MILSITYKQQRKELNLNQFDSASSVSSDQCQILFQKLADIFNIERNDRETLLLEYPNAKLLQLSMNNNDDEDLVIISLDTDGYFLCKPDRQYELRPGKRVSVQPIFDKEKCHFSIMDIEMAAILSDAVYYADPISHINKNYSSYSCISTLTSCECGLKFASNASSPYLLAISKSNINEETLWVAFRGTTNINDVLTDLTIHPMLTTSGMAHRGFSKRASELPHDTLMNEFHSTFDDRKRLIFTGHSLGGSVAHLCAIFSLSNKSFKQNPQIFSITFGAPFIGNSTVAKDLIKRNFNDHFLTIVNENDIVPNLLNLVETGTRLQSTIAPIAESCLQIAKTILPLVSLATGVPAKVINTSVETLNLLIPQLKNLLKNKITEYKPIGQYGFIRSVLSSSESSNLEPTEWIITYKSNTMKIDDTNNEEKFIDVISKKLIESLGPSTATITDVNIINHYMEKYISSLLSCEIIRTQSSINMSNNQWQVTEVKRFSPHIRKATAICSDTDIKITITGDHLDFLSTHKRMCVNTSENFFQPNSVITISEISRNKLVLMNNSLIPIKERVTVGPRKYTLDTHFGNIDLMLELYVDDDNNNNQQTTLTFHELDMNFLMATFLRSFFDCLHSNNDLFSAKSTSRYFAKLLENRLPNKYEKFKSLLERHFNRCQQMKNLNKPISIDQTLYNDMSGLINDLFKVLIEVPNYTFNKSFLQRVKENPGSFAIFGTVALFGTCVLLQAGLLGLIGYQLFGASFASFVGTQFAAVDLLTMAVGTVGSYRMLGIIGRDSLDRLIYHEHLAFLLNSIGGNSDKCANEKMLEIQICDILKNKSIDFDCIIITDHKGIEKIIKDTHLFVMNEGKDSTRLMVSDTTIDSQINAFKFLHNIYYICRLRQLMTTQYISFIGAHRAGKSSLLKSLWNIPAERGDYLDNRTKQMQIYTLYDDNSSNRVHLIDYPGVTDPVKTIAHLNQNYSVFSTFYVIVVRAGTDYNSAAALINELQMSASLSPITSLTETHQQVVNATTATQTEPINGSLSTDQNRIEQKYGLNQSAKFVVIITGIDTITDSLIENELNEALNKRLKIDKGLICMCYNKEAIDDENYLRLHEPRNLPGISDVRTFLTEHFNQILDKHSNFNTYKYRER